jgi:hypothetical protein
MQSIEDWEREQAEEDKRRGSEETQVPGLGSKKASKAARLEQLQAEAEAREAAKLEKQQQGRQISEDDDYIRSLNLSPIYIVRLQGR